MTDKAQSTPAVYPPEVQAIAKAIRIIDTLDSPNWAKRVRIGYHLYVASHYLDAETFDRWVQDALHRLPDIARLYIHFSLSLMPIPVKKQRELDHIRATFLSKTGQTQDTSAQAARKIQKKSTKGV